MIDMVESARKVAPVHVVTMPGNHDRLAAWHMGHALECYFHNYKDVTFDNSPTARKYFEWGVNMLMFTHGDSGNRHDYPLLMAAEQPEMFGRTKFREIHCGHTHETKTIERHGIRVRVLPALCPPDEWHAANGFVGNQRNAEGYIYNNKEGMIGMVVYNDQSQEPIVTKREIIQTRDEDRAQETQDASE
jgi:DNA repair exonuclease SbcCD nuclease subunit